VSYSNDSRSHHQVPAHFTPLFTAAAIAERVKELGRELSTWCRSVRDTTGRDVLAVPVLRGGLFFFSDLSRAIDTSVEIAPIKASSYDNTEHDRQLHSVSVIADGVDVRDRSVLIVDDFCDSGRTLEEVERLLIARGAHDVRSSVLVRRLLDRPSFVPCWVGFEYPGTDWLVGYGLEDKERWRNLPAVYGIKAS